MSNDTPDFVLETLIAPDNVLRDVNAVQFKRAPFQLE
jgi:hypothetical protein